MQLILSITKEQEQLLLNMGFTHIDIPGTLSNSFVSSKSYFTDFKGAAIKYCIHERYKNRDCFYVFEGEQKHFVSLHASLFRLVFRDNVGSIVRPVHYFADNHRLHWYEDEAIYLNTRATWEEFSDGFLRGNR